MHLSDGFNYFNGGTFQALEIPYKSGELSMIVFLPNDIGGLPALEHSLTASNMQQWLSQLQSGSDSDPDLAKIQDDTAIRASRHAGRNGDAAGV